MIINAKTVYVDENGEVYDYEKLKDYHYYVRNEKTWWEHNDRFNQHVRHTFKEITIRGRKAKQQTLF